MNKKMADVDVDPFEEHGKTDETTDEAFPLTPRGESTWEPEREQETSFGGKSHESEISKEKKLKNCTNYQVIKYIKDWNLVWTCSNLAKMVNYIIEGTL